MEKRPPSEKKFPLNLFRLSRIATRAVPEESQRPFDLPKLAEWLEMNGSIHRTTLAMDNIAYGYGG
jgi:hypothetical protein